MQQECVGEDAASAGSAKSTMATISLSVKQCCLCRQREIVNMSFGRAQDPQARLV